MTLICAWYLHKYNEFGFSFSPYLSLSLSLSSASLQLSNIVELYVEGQDKPFRFKKAQSTEELNKEGDGSADSSTKKKVCGWDRHRAEACTWVCLEDNSTKAIAYVRAVHN